MSKYNLSKFNLSKYNIDSASGENIAFSIECNESIDLMIAFSVNTPIAMTGTENIETLMSGAVSIPFAIEQSSAVNLSATLQSVVVIKAEAAEVVGMNVDVIKDIAFVSDLDEIISVDVYVGTDIATFLDVKENLNTNFYAGKDIKIFSAFLNEDLMTSFKTTILNEVLMMLDIDLAPGQTIEIDTNKFTAYISTENVVDKINGEWIMLNNNIVALEVSSGSGGNLSGRLIYNERYL